MKTRALSGEIFYMVDRKLTDQLDSPSPEKRKAAIQQLARSKDMEAIRHLEAVERLDSDSTVRDMASKAVAYIKRQNAGAAPAAAAAPAVTDPPVKPDKKSAYAAGSIMAEYASRTPKPGEEAPPEKLTEAPLMVDVPEARRKTAKTALDMASRAVFDEQMGRAAKYLVEAFKLNPNLKHDAYAVGLAATTTGLYKTDAVKAIVDGSALELFDKKELTAKPPKPKNKNEDMEAEEDQVPATWSTAIVDLLLYGLINAVIIGISVIVLINFIVSTIQNDPVIQEQLAQNGMTAANFVGALSQVAIIDLILYVLLYGLIAIVMLLISSSFIHVAATMILGGEGTLANLIHRTALFLGVMTGLNFAAGIVGFFLPVVSDPTIGTIIWAVSFFVSIWTFIGYTNRVGKAYDMGSGKGCAAVFLSGIMFAIIGVICFAVLGQAFMTQLDAMLAAQGGIMTIVTPVTP
jgi:hypothetical protein